jgi:multicomponent Na+:H+ antiporter subunit C
MDITTHTLLTIGFYGSSISLILIGLYAALVKKSLLKIIIGMSIVDSGINLLLVSLGYLNGGTAPIFSPTVQDTLTKTAKAVDPVPQALVLTAIVIGFAVTAVALSLIIRLYRHHKTVSIDEIKNLKW